MISMRCKRCGEEVELKDKGNSREYKEILTEDQCVDCYGSITSSTEQEMLDKIFNEEE